MEEAPARVPRVGWVIPRDDRRLEAQQAAIVRREGLDRASQRPDLGELPLQDASVGEQPSALVRLRDRRLLFEGGEAVGEQAQLDRPQRLPHRADLRVAAGLGDLPLPARDQAVRRNSPGRHLTLPAPELSQEW
jgi:hypothetical protein